MNSAHLIKTIKARALIPISQQTFSDEDLLDFANDAIRTRIIPFVLKHNREYNPKLLSEPNVENLSIAFHPIVAQAVISQVLQSLGFIDKAEAAYRTLERMEEDVIPLLAPKKPKRIISRMILSRYS